MNIRILQYILVLGALFVLFFCQGCGSMLDKIPDNSFQELTWTRTILGTTGLIEAKDGMKKDGIMTVGIVHIKEVTPWGQLEVSMVGYTREVTNGKL